MSSLGSLRIRIMRANAVSLTEASPALKIWLASQIIQPLLLEPVVPRCQRFRVCAIQYSSTLSFMFIKSSCRLVAKAALCISSVGNS